MFFVLAGTPTVRTPEGEEQLSPGDVVYLPGGQARKGSHDFSNPTDRSRLRLLAISSKRFPALSLTRSGESMGATRPTPERPVPEAAADGIIARLANLPPQSQ